MHRSATDIHNVVFFHTGFKSIRLNVLGQITLACKSIDRTDCLHQELIWMVFYLFFGHRCPRVQCLLGDTQVLVCNKCLNVVLRDVV